MSQTIEIGLYESLLRRVAALETRMGLTSVSTSVDSEFLAEISSKVGSLTEDVFGVPASISPRRGDPGEDDYVLVSVEVDADADPKDMANRHSVWHHRMTKLDLDDKDLIRLKVMYK